MTPLHLSMEIVSSSYLLVQSKQQKWRHSGVFIVILEHIPYSPPFLVFITEMFNIDVCSSR